MTVVMPIFLFEIFTKKKKIIILEIKSIYLIFFFFCNFLPTFLKKITKFSKQPLSRFNNYYFYDKK